MGLRRINYGVLQVLQLAACSGGLRWDCVYGFEKYYGNVEVGLHEGHGVPWDDHFAPLLEFLAALERERERERERAWIKREEGFYQQA